MASHKAHHATGWAAGVIAAAVVAHAGAEGSYFVWSILALLAGVSGGTAPDWLELAWWSRRRRLWITHRTLTHWGLGWLGLLAYSYFSLGRHPWAPVLFGFAAGGVMHLLADWPNPLGVPWIFGRHSLRWWRSGRCDMIVIASSWLLAIWVSDYVYFDNVHGLKAIMLVKSLPLWSFKPV
jgi:membrane-bound metal-dependent hydrolase YbcI (DUF457 family)